MTPSVRICWIILFSGLAPLTIAQTQKKSAAPKAKPAAPAVAAAPAPPAAAVKTEILWDRYGTPHIFAPTVERMFYAHGYAQMHNHANLLLKLYGESRARGAEYWGREYAELDRWLLVNDLPNQAQEWYRAQTPAFKKNLIAFARGINAYARAHPKAISDENKQVLPVNGLDVVQHTMRVVFYGYMGSRARFNRELGQAAPTPEAGSNTWAIGPSRSASGNAMLIINPHLQWGGFYTYMEVHLNAPGVDLYGAPQIGFPMPVVGFNRRMGWSRTVNTIDTVDFYRLTPQSDGYLLDGRVEQFETDVATFRIKGSARTYTEENVRIIKSKHGPVVHNQSGQMIAMRVAGLDRPRMLEQWFRMGTANNLKEFQAALRMASIPMWNACYADADGHTMLVFNGLVPKRKSGDWEFWSKIVPGDTSETLWTTYLPFSDLPKVIDPPSGFVQNANEPPWMTTSPTLEPAKYAPFVAPDDKKLASFRAKRSYRMAFDDASITYEELVAAKHSTRVELAEAVLDDLLAAARDSGSSSVKDAARVLDDWDRNVNSDSRGAVLFWIFATKFYGNGSDYDEKMRIKFDPADPVKTPAGIADPAAALVALEAAADECRRRFGSLDIRWGDVFRFTRGTLDLPANGGFGRLGIFRTMTFGRPANNRYYPVSGETFVCAIEFSTPQRANCLLGYGNSSQPDSAHVSDQLQMLADRKLHPVWRERADIEKNLESSEVLK